MAERIVDIYVSPAMNAKINSKKPGLTEDDVWAISQRVTRAYRVSDEERGRRVYVEGRTEYGQPAIIVLYPTGEDGYWNLGTARRS